MSRISNNLALIKRSSYASASKRFLALIFDLIITAILSYLLFLGAKPIAQNNESVQEAFKQADDEATYYLDYIRPTKLAKYDEDPNSERYGQILPNSNSIITEESIRRAIYESYMVYEGEFYPEDFVMNEECKKYGRADENADPIHYFYLNYLPNNDTDKQILDTKGLTYAVCLNEEYKLLTSPSYHVMYEFQEDSYPVIKSTYSYYMYAFLFNTVEPDSPIYSYGKDYLSAFESTYQALLERATDLMISAEPYYSQHYLVYVNSNTKINNAINLALFISIIIGSTLYIVVSKGIFANGRTVGRIMMSLGRFTDDKEDNKLRYILGIILKDIAYIINSIILMFPLYFLPPFNFAFNGLSMPFTPGTPMNFTILLFVIILLAAINGAVILFTHKKVSLLDIATNSIVVDTHHVDELDMEG